MHAIRMDMYISPPLSVRALSPFLFFRLHLGTICNMDPHTDSTASMLESTLHLALRVVLIEPEQCKGLQGMLDNLVGEEQVPATQTCKNIFAGKAIVLVFQT